MRPEPLDNFFFFSQGVELLLWPLNASFSTSSCPHLSWLALSLLLIVLTHTPQKMQIPYYRDTLDHFQGQRCAPLSPTNLQDKLWYDPKSLTMSWMGFFLCMFTIIILKGCLGLEQIWLIPLFLIPTAAVQTLLYICTTSFIIIWNTLPLWTWYCFTLFIDR